MTRRLGVAGLQLMKYPDSELNVSRFEDVVTKTKTRYPWIDLLFVGELFLQKYGVKNWKDHAQPIPNELTERLSQLAKKNHSWLVPGSFLEKDGSKIYNTSVVFDPFGKIVAKYRKLFPWVPYEDTAFGSDFTVFEIPDIAKVGLTICYDVWFPEVYRTLAWMGAEVILEPSASYTPDRDAELVLVQAEAIMNQCYVLNVNTIESQGGGRSLFADPEGRIIQQAGTHEEVMIHALDLDRVSWVHDNGSYAISPVWKALRDSPLEGRFPPYRDFRSGVVFKGLKETKVQSSLREWKT